MSTPFSPVTASPLLDLHISHPAPGTTRVRVSGEVDLFTATVLLQRLLQVLREQRPTVLDVDLATVTFLDCHGVDALVVARDAARHAGVQLRVSHPQRIVRRVLDLVGLLGIFADPIEVARPPATGPGRTKHGGPPRVPAVKPR
jgi:anti-anti-sigma factor